MKQPTVGSMIGGLRLDAVAGVGGMGSVFRAYDPALDRTVALKVIAPRLASDSEFRDRFRREARLAASLDHPHVVPVLGAGEDSGYLYLVMRLVEGTDLAKIIRTAGRLDPAYAGRLVVQVASALDAAHARGLVHRDVKPANVLVAQREGGAHAYLTDFGISKEVSESGMTQTGLVVGTVDYMAPEQAVGGSFDGRADQYALACVLFQALTGSLPYAAGNQIARLTAHVRAPVPDVRSRVPDIDPRLAEAIRRAMAKSPDARYNSCRAFADAVEAAVVSRGATDTGHSASVPRRLLIGGAAVVLVGGVGGALAYSRSRHSPGASSSGTSSASPTGPLAVDVVGDQIDLPGETRSIAGDDRELWTANGDAASISRIDVASRKVTSTVTTPGVPTWLTVGNGRVWVWSYSSAFVLFDASSGARIGTDLLRIDEEMRQLSAAAPHLWFTVPGKNRVGYLDMRSDSPRPLLIDLASRPLGLDASGDQVHVVVEDPSALVTISAETGAISGRVQVPSGIHSVAAVDGGRRYVAGRQGVAEVTDAGVADAGLIEFPMSAMVEPTATGVWALDPGERTIRLLAPDLRSEQGRPLTELPVSAISLQAIGTSLWVAGDRGWVLQLRPKV